MTICEVEVVIKLNEEKSNVAVALIDNFTITIINYSEGVE